VDAPERRGAKVAPIAARGQFPGPVRRGQESRRSRGWLAPMPARKRGPERLTRVRPARPGVDHRITQKGEPFLGHDVALNSCPSRS